MNGKNMTGRERLSRVYCGKLADRIPWAPIMDDKTLSEYDEQTQKKGIIEFTRRIGADIFGRCSIIKEARNNHADCSRVTDKSDPAICYDEIKTQKGSIKCTFHGHSIVEPLLKTPESFQVWLDYYENRSFTVDCDRFFETEKAIGDDGITSTAGGPCTPVQDLVQVLMGVDNFAYALCDYPAEMDELIERMHRKNMEAYKLVASKSPSKYAMLVENTSTTMISPEIYRKYSMGHVRDFVDIMHESGKIAIIHMCGLINDLLPLIKQTGLDGIDCLTPPPTGDTDFRDAYRIIGGHLMIHGMIDPTDWLPGSVSIDKIAENIENLLKPEIINKPYVFCTGSDGLPGIPLEKYEAIRKKIGEYVF